MRGIGLLIDSHVLDILLHDLPQCIDRLAEFDAVLSAYNGNRATVQFEGLAGVARSLLLARVYQKRPSQILVVTYQTDQAQSLWDDLVRFGIPEDDVMVLPASESRWLSNDATDFRAWGERIRGLARLASGTPCIVIGTAESILQRTSPSTDIVDTAFTVRLNQTIDLDQLLNALTEMGYQSETTVARPGQFSKRGGILDIFPSTLDEPIRIELFGDEIDSIRKFDITTQRSVANISDVTVYPAREIRLRPDRIDNAIPAIKEALQLRKMEHAKKKNKEAFEQVVERVEDDIQRISNGVFFDGLEEYRRFLVPEEICALDFLLEGYTASPPGAAEPLVVVDEPGQIKTHWERLCSELGDTREKRVDRGELLEHYDFSEDGSNGLRRIGSEFHTLTFSEFRKSHHELPASKTVAVSSAVTSSYRNQLAQFASEVANWLANGAQCYVISDQPHRVKEICAELNIPVGPTFDGTPALLVGEGRLRHGIKFVDIGLLVATDAELFGTARPVHTRKRATGGIPVSTILDLRENDFVVHINHGIGVYRGMVSRKIENTERDYIHIQYGGGDSLFVPADQIDRIQRYVGSEGAPPQVHRIGGGEWQKATRKVKEQAKEIAKELIELYAARQSAERPSFGPDTPWQTEMEDAFPYEETRGQLNAIHDVKADLEESRPMDRLVCGDVGFGKTEVAIRAAFKVVEAGRQVAILCPTTVLAAQHHLTFSERFAAYPAKVELLSRYRTAAEQRKVLTELKAGLVDVVVGTHRLLSKDIEFSNLGMIIVDEEQRFGVSHKERLKQMRKSVDVLTLTATPIPRTLSMALSGLRDMSVIEDPPPGRMPITTYVREYDNDLVKDAILRELERDGQVYFVHNRIESIEHVAQRLQRMVPDARIAIGHGQMSEDDLEGLMNSFYHRDIDILVCTTNIENGLDVSNANTLIIDAAHRMGLSQLYQLRGRVGRSNRQAYAYLLYNGNKALSEEAERRLSAIREFTALGSGFQVAMRDLEIRGAGNLLGAEQSGAIVTVGYDLYCQLLAQAVSEAKGGELTEEILPPVDLPLNAHIPTDYVPNEAERIFLYKKMSNVKSVEDIAALQEEMEDRYGDPPKPVWTALAVVRLRLRCKGAGIASVRGERTEVVMRFASNVRLSPDSIRKLMLLFKKHRFTGDSVTFTLTTPKIMDEIESVVEVLEKALTNARSES